MSSDINGVRRMVGELQNEPVPALPWAEIERRLLAQIDRDRRAQGIPSSPFARIAGVIAAAAAITLAVSMPSSPASPPKAIAERRVDAASIALAEGHAQARDLSALRAGDVIEAKDAAISFHREGVVTWTLAPGGRARVVSMGDEGVGHTVALLSGSLRAEVTPVTPRDASEGLIEAFSVEVEGTRVAVHGTAFSVTHADDHVVVDVEHGAVAVGPVGHAGATTGRLLVGPSRASFSLDGGKRAALLPRPLAMTGALAADAHKPAAVALRAPSAPPSIEPVAQHDAPSLEPVAQHEPIAPHAPAIAPKPAKVAAAESPAPPAIAEQKPVEPAPLPLLTPGAVASRVVSCLRAGTNVSGVTVSFSSSLLVTVRDDGSVVGARFTTPPKPELVGCASFVVSARFSPGARTIEIPITY